MMEKNKRKIKFMSIKYVEGDLFKAVDERQSDKPLFIPHVCNDKGAWGAGFVVPLGKRFTRAKSEYELWHLLTKNNSLSPFAASFELGMTQIITVEDNKEIYVCNMVAQTLGGTRPLFYNKLTKCMDDVAKQVLEKDGEIYCPLFGSSLAGGDPYMIEALMHDCWIRTGIPVTVYYLAHTVPEKFLKDITQGENANGI